MTAEQLLNDAIEFRESEKREAEKTRLKFELDNPENLPKWQEAILKRDSKRIMIIDGLIQIIQAQEMDYDSDQEVIKAIDELEHKMHIKGGIDLRDHVIEVLIHDLADIFENIQFLPKSLTKIFLILKLKRIDKLLCDYKIKVFEANNIPYVIEEN